MMTLSTNTVLVTGAAGWLGSRLVEALLHGRPEHPALAVPHPTIRIRCLVPPREDSSRISALSERIEIVQGDLRNPEDCRRFCSESENGILFHAAGLIHPRFVRDLYRVNVEGTNHLLEAAVKGGIRRAVIVSSNSPCGVNPHPDHLFDENSPYNPYLNYGRSKMLMELAVRKKQDSGELQTVIIRAPWFYGPNQPPRQTLFFRMVRDGKAPIVGSGKNLRSMAYVDNLCQGLLLAAVSEQENGKVYWIADRRPYSMVEIIDTVERLLETEFGQKCAHRRLRLPAFASLVAYDADRTLQRLGLYHQKIHVLSEMDKTIACSTRKAECELGYNPAVELEEGMRRSISWCMNSGNWH